jgi:hypothetical protein
MLPDVTLPASLAGLLWALRPVFTAPSFGTFCGLVAGLAGQVRRRTVCGMLVGAGLGRCWPHDRAHYFFARAAWDLDALGLAVARLVVGLGRPAFSGQLYLCYFMLRAAGSDTRRGPLAESCSRVPNGDVSDCSGSRCTGQYPPVLSSASGRQSCAPARPSPQR